MRKRSTFGKVMIPFKYLRIQREEVKKKKKKRLLQMCCLRRKQDNDDFYLQVSIKADDISTLTNEGP